MLRTLRASALSFGVAAMVMLAQRGSAVGAEDEWLDIESRIQYGYYTEDSRAVQEVSDLLAAQTSASAMRHYYLGLAGYRVALLSITRDAGKARDALGQCTSNVDASLKLDAHAAEGLALESACLELLGSLSAVRAPFASSAGRSQMQRALSLAPKNPRVLLLEGLEDYDREHSSNAARAEVIGTLQRSVAAFELERKSVEHPPAWGAAEAYAFLARSLLDRGDALAAREALEHALLLAPDFAYAHRLLNHIISGRLVRPSDSGASS